jgi:hypothetical protein
MFRNSKKQGDAGLGQAIAYFTMKGYEVALPLTDSADWDLIVEIDGELQRVQVKTSSQMRNNTMVFNCDVKGGNKTAKTPAKTIPDQQWDLLFLYHLETKDMALIPKMSLSTNGQVNLGKKYEKYIIR